MMIRAIGILLVILGVPKAFVCLRTVLSVIPVAAEAGMPTGILWHAGLLNLCMAVIAIGKTVGGFGLLWTKRWAMMTAAVAALLHALFLAYSFVPIWIQMLQGTFENTGRISFHRDYVAMAVNITIAATLILVFMKEMKREAQPAH